MRLIIIANDAPDGRRRTCREEEKIGDGGPLVTIGRETLFFFVFTGRVERGWGGVGDALFVAYIQDGVRARDGSIIFWNVRKSSK